MIRAGEILRSLDWRRKTMQLRRLDELAKPECEAVMAALAELPPDAEVNLDKLINEVRLQAEERAEQAKPDPTAAFNYFVTIATEDQLLTMKRELQNGASVREAMRTAQRVRPWTSREAHDVVRGGTIRPAPIDGPEEPNEEPDDTSKPRSRVRRRRRRAGDPEASDTPRCRPLLLGPKAVGDNRPYGCPLDAADYRAWASPEPPPWLNTNDGAPAKEQA